MGLVYNATEGKEQYLVFLDNDGNGGGGIKQEVLMSVTTEPSAPFTKGSKYFNSTTKLIYTATEDNVWGTDGKSPEFGTIYQCNDLYYVWDGDNLVQTDLEQYELLANKSTVIDPTTANNTTYPTTQAVANYVNTQSFVKNFSDVGITATSGTMAQLAQDIQSKHLETGTILYGEITCSDMPFQGNAEVRVEILETKGSPNYYQVLEFTLYSTNVEPYEWSFTYYQPQFTTWTWVPKAVPTNDYTSDSTNTVPTSKALRDGLSSVTGANLYDIKLLSQAIAGEEEKGWACLSHTTRKDIAKASVPTLYENILTKYNNVEKSELPWTNGASYTETDFFGGQRFIGCHNNVVYIADEHSICSSSNPINTAFTQVFWKRFLRYGTLFCGSKWLIIGGSSDRYNVDSLVIMNYETNDTKEISFSGGSSLFFKEIGNYIYIVCSDNNKIYRIVNNNYNDVTSDDLELVIDFSGTNFNNIVDILYDNDNSVWYFVSVSTSRFSYTYIHKATDISNISTYTENIWVTPNQYDWGTNSRIFKYNNRLVVYVPCNTYIRIWYTDDNFGNVTSLSENFGTYLSQNPVCYFTQKNSDIYMVTLHTYRSGGNNYSYSLLVNTNIVSTQTSMTQLVDTLHNSGDISNIVFDNNNHNFIFWDYKIHYSGLAPITYTDTYQINGSSVAINYYKYNDWKICLPNPTNDTNLDTVYAYLGYLNYWRLDLTSGSETVSLPRNSNLWTMMYVGDDYKDSNLPSGEYSAVALKSETKYLIKDVDVSSTITINLDKEHKAYQITTPTSNFSLSIDNTNCPIGKEVKDIILIIDMSASAQAYEITWANNIKWGNTSPTMTALVKYMFSFTTIDGGQTWIGNQMFSW